MSPDLATRLQQVNIQIVAAMRQYTVVGRDNLVAVIAESGSLGSTGMMTESGFAYLIWRDGRALLASKGVETPATDEQVQAIRSFSEDLKRAVELEEKMK